MEDLDVILETIKFLGENIGKIPLAMHLSYDFFFGYDT